MQCPNCRAECTEDDTYCHLCRADLAVHSMSITATQTRNLPAVLYNSPLPRTVAAGIGAIALGVGIELLRRSLLTRLTQPPRPAENALPALSDLKDIFMPQNNKQQLKLPKGYQVQETFVYTSRVIRREI